MRPADQLLYDSEATLRLVDHAIEELSATGAELDREASGLLAHVMAQPGVFARLQQMRGHLSEVTSATETATTDILDGLARAAALVEQIDEVNSLSDDERHRMASSLREELCNVVNHLQFQDITGQQLKYIGHLLGDMNRRMTQVVQIFTPPTSHPAEPDPAAAREGGFSTEADGQAVADEIFAVRALKSA